jgi:DNA-binding CsgD family transcriptional regulator
MTKSDLLRVQDVRDAYRLIGECRDLGSDPVLWYRHVLAGLCRLVGARAAVGGEGLWVRPQRTVEPLSVFDAGLDQRGQEVLMAYHRELGPADDPIFQALQHVPGRLVTRSRRQLVSDAVWYRSACFSYHRLNDTDHQLTSVYQVADSGAISAVTVHRAIGERDFSAREQRLLNFLHGELGPLIGRALVSAAEPSPERLSPRLRQTLACLVEGDSEKQVAARLDLSHATAHQYVTALYRHFGVQSRAQLLAHIIRRIVRGEWRQFLSDGRPSPAVPRAGEPRTNLTVP